ncbi:MAG: ABC transporter permease [Desulfovibrio sp.]|jgi:phospholipid/cholesterol/gamma-HCH transport system permease protein|nr:ABC transporter permease [Desulfovibrio sp.]
MQDSSQGISQRPQNRVLMTRPAPDSLSVRIGGQWRMGDVSPGREGELGPVLSAIEGGGVRRITLKAETLEQWDSSLLVFLVKLAGAARDSGITVKRDLPNGLARLVDLAFAVPATVDDKPKIEKEGLAASVGARVLALGPAISVFLVFIGEFSQSCHRLLLGRAHTRSQDFFSAVYECGVAALPIISLTSMLFGLILAFVGSVQLTQFGAQVYVAGLVSIGMLRIMGAIMVGVVMSGRVGAAYAALTGAMQANEEVDALRAAGIYPVDFLVLPRVLAMTAMAPLLTLYADIMGVIGGFLVAVTLMGLNPYEYLNATVQMTPFRHVLLGLVYGTVFGVIVALSGCFHGMNSGRSAQAVGLATTTAVVHSIVGIIVATAVITCIASALNI